jgi:hypothetical protein
MQLRDLWDLPLEEQRARRRYESFEEGRHYEPWAENAAPNLPKVGRYYVVDRTDGTSAVIDPERPWNNAVVSIQAKRPDAVRWAERETARLGVSRG